MNSPLPPLERLFERTEGSLLPLPSELENLYGPLRFSLTPERPFLIGNFVTTLDGVVSLNVPGQDGGGPISGFNAHDHMVMGLLRGVADAVIVGAETWRAVSDDHRWTAPYIYPPLADAYQHLRVNLAREAPPLNVLVTARGEIDLHGSLFQAGDVPVCIITTQRGEQRLRAQSIPPGVRIVQVPETPHLDALAIVQAVCQVRPCSIILVEGGPRILGGFLAANLLDELFLTLAPQIAGRDVDNTRPGLVSGQLFAPEYPLWGTLVSVKRGDSHLFLRYTFQTQGKEKFPHEM